ncbi:MAG: GNAT family N-acetyltransferase [Gemmatimonadota bacterium]
MTVLVPMTEAEYAEFVAQTVVAYAADKVASGEWLPHESLALAQKVFDELLPQGLATPGNHLFTIRPRRDLAAVGRLWFAVQERAGKRIAYVYDVGVQPQHQRQGHASGAFFALEAEAARLGLSGIALHVFGHNAAAQAMYVKLGFHVTDINMYKPVGSAGA